MRQPALIFDLDGTLVDSVYQHVAAWHDALRKNRIPISQWRIHRAIGMSGSLFLPKLLRAEGIRHPHKLIDKLEAAHDKNFDTLIPRVDVLPGSTNLFEGSREQVNSLCDCHERQRSPDQEIARQKSCSASLHRSYSRRCRDRENQLQICLKLRRKTRERAQRLFHRGGQRLGRTGRSTDALGRNCSEMWRL